MNTKKLKQLISKSVLAVATAAVVGVSAVSAQGQASNSGCSGFECSGVIWGETFYWCCEDPCDVGCGDAVDMGGGIGGLYCVYDANCAPNPYE